jgi:hypothetical protein
MARLAAGIAATARSAAAQAQGRAVGLDMAKTLAVIALLGWNRNVSGRSEKEAQTVESPTFSGSRMRASVGLVSGLLAVVAEPLRGGADFRIVADVATLIAGPSRQGRHPESLQMFCSGCAR